LKRVGGKFFYRHLSKKQIIALCHFRVGEIDGVSLEMDKWKMTLEELGHHVIYIAGSSGSLDNVEIIQELHYNDADNNKIVENAYIRYHSFNSEQSFKNKIENIAKSIEEKLINIIEKNKIDILIVNNIFSLGWNLSAGVGFFSAIKKTDVKCICHHHDFSWERKKYSNPTLPFIADYLNNYFPPKHTRLKHIVINSIAQKELLKRKNIKSIIIPNVFDFDKVWKIDDYNFDFRESFGIKKNDLIVLQATRIVKRKGIELAIDFVAELCKNKHRLIGKKLYNNLIFTANNNIVFLMVGSNEDDPYFEKITKYAHKKQIVIKWVNKNIDHLRSQKNDTKTYSLWDAYVHCDIVAYTSLLEGWGNQFIEALVAKKIIISYQYPVFKNDIIPLKFNTVDLGNKHNLKEDGLTQVNHTIIVKAVNDCIALILNKEKYKQTVLENYNIGKKNLSLNTLKKLLKPIVENEK